ncbi:MAG: hypothetical protein LAP85_27390 [Acidobacteriia bacterium]|nr:hypothetical protein [Terriglobia bacterium]
MNDAEKATIEALRIQLGNLEETIADLLHIALARPAGELRDQLVDKISCLDSIADVLRQALDAIAPPLRANLPSDPRSPQKC